jgi:hypothetical protein
MQKTGFGYGLVDFHISFYALSSSLFIYKLITAD